jgi:ornithine carbamoyltransferase
LPGKDLLSISDLGGEDIRRLISEAVAIKARGWLSVLNRRTLALLFEKPSLRTRVSFELAMRQLGGEALYLSPAEVGLGKRESVSDVARVLSRYVDAITARTFAHQTLEELASSAEVPVINALSDREHPCQALADLLTVFEKKGELAGLAFAYVGDGNNVAHSLMLAASLTGMDFRIATPDGYQIDPAILERARDYAAANGAQVTCAEKPESVVSGADVVYTDVWVSMGEEAEAARRREAFRGYQLNEALFALAKEDAILMHCLPAHRGEEVSAEIIDQPYSVVFDQAENRLHMQKAILAMLLGGLEDPLRGY